MQRHTFLAAASKRTGDPNGGTITMSADLARRSWPVKTAHRGELMLTRSGSRRRRSGSLRKPRALHWNSGNHAHTPRQNESSPADHQGRPGCDL